jgi:multiple sugar transport system substrate-binding protein
MMRRIIIGMVSFVLAMGLLLSGATQAAPVELSIWTAFPELHEQVKWIGEKYTQKHPNVKIKATLFPQRALEEKVAVALPAGQAADLIELDKMGFYPYYVAGYIEPLPKDVVGWVKKSFPDYSVASVTSDKGEIFTFPWLNSLKVMFYNKDHFKEAGLTKPPETIEEMVEMGKKLTKRDEKGNLTRVGLDLRLSGGGFGTSQKYWCQAMIPYGVEVLEKVGNKWRAGYDNEAGYKALQFYIDVVHKHKLDSLDFKSDAEAFGLGMTSMFQREAWVVGYMEKNAPKINYGVFLMPKGPGGWGTVGNSMGLSIPKSCKHKKEAFGFAMFMMNDEMSRATFVDSGWQPFRKGVDYSDLYKERPQLETFIKAAETPGHAVLDYENIEPIFEIHSRMADRLMAAFKRADLMDNPSGIAEVVGGMAKETNNILDEYGLLAK